MNNVGEIEFMNLTFDASHIVLIFNAIGTEGMKGVLHWFAK